MDFKNIVNITNLNCSHLYLNDNDNNNIFISETENLDINIVLNTRVIGTKYIIKLTKNQNPKCQFGHQNQESCHNQI